MSDEKKLDLENELGLMGCVLQDAMKCLPLIRNRGGCESWFRHNGLKALWVCVTGLTDAGKPVDPLTALEEWRRLYCKQDVQGKEKGQTELPEADVGLIQRCIDSAVTIAHVEFYADSVREKHIANMARSVARSFSADVGHGTQSAIQEMASKLQDLLEEASKGGRKYSMDVLVPSIMDDINTAYDVVMVKGKGKVRYCPGLELPWQHVNNMYGGALPGLHIISGRPSTGKTTLVNNFLRFWADYLKVHGGVNSMDMTPKMFMMRNVSEMSAVSLPKALKGDLRRDQLERWATAAERIKGWNVEMDVIHDLDRFRSWVTLGVMKKGWKFAVIDHIQLMKFNGSMRMGVNDRIEIISGSIKNLANDLGIPIFALSQLSRDCEKDQRKPTASDLRGGGSLEQDAKTVLMLYKDPKVAEAWKNFAPKHLAAYSEDQKTNEYMAKKLRPVFACLEKNQDGETGDIPLVMYPNYFRFRLADYLAETCIEYDEKNPKKIIGRNETAKFGRVHPDWRQFKEDERFARAGGLVTDYDDGKV